MNKLQLKLLRDLGGSTFLFLAVSMVILLGVAFFNAASMGYQNLKSSHAYSYETLHFADFTIKVVEAPGESIEKLESIPGVKAVTGRVKADIPLTIPGDEAKKILARVITLPSGSRPAVNDVKVQEGSYFQENDSNELLVEKSFANYHKLNPGDTVSLTLNGQEGTFKVVGIVMSPEYIWPAKSRQELMVSAETFGVVFIPQGTMTRLSGSPSLNEFCIIVDKGGDRAAVIKEAETILGPYGIMEVVPVEEQPSNAALSVDFQEMGNMAKVFPFLFLIVGALATYILITRIVISQRAQIGLMRAVGYSLRQVLLHYLSFTLIIGILGAVIGTLVGYLLSRVVTEIYASTMGLPFIRIETQWLTIVEGLFLGIISCVIAGIVPAYTASRLSPAEAMRTPAPAAGRKLFLEQIFPFLARLSHLWKIPLRNIFRNRGRSVYTFLGIAFGISLILVSSAYIESVNSMMDLQFNRIQKYDAQVAFTQLQPMALASEVQGVGDFKKVEPVLQVPVRLEHDGKFYTTMAIGLSQDAELYGLYSTTGDTASVSNEGILLSGALRKTLDVDIGDVITLQTVSTLRDIKVVGFVKQPLGAFTYVTLNQAQELIGDQPVISGLMLGAEPQYLDSLRQRASQIADTASVELTAETKAKVGERMAFNCRMIWIMFGFGVALSFAIVFTTVSISILERRREIAAMRAQGESKGGITAMVTIQNVLLGLAGIILGIPLGYGLSMYLFSFLQTDMVTYSLVISPGTYLFTVGTIVLVMLISQVPSIRRLNRLELARVIKEQAT